MYKSYICIITLFFSIYEGTSEETLCQTRGRFPNNLTPDCRGYTMCLMGAGGYAKFDLLCPENSTYSHLDNQCTNVTSYQCLSDFNCTQEGNLANPSSENCTTYIACVKDLLAITTARLVTCPSNEVFSPRETMCVNETLYKCYFDNQPPKVPKVDQFPSLSGNFSVKSSACVNTLGGILIVFLAVIMVLQ